MNHMFRFLCFMLFLQYNALLAFSSELTSNALETNYTLPVIPLIDNEITNPDRGFCRWNGNEMAPFPSIDRYARYNWTVFETSEGVYNFSSLYNEAAAAYADPDGRGTFGLAFRCVVEGVDHAYPAYLDAKMTSWYSNNKKCWVPDWNNAYFLARHDSLVANLGRACRGVQRKPPRNGRQSALHLELFAVDCLATWRISWILQTQSLLACGPPIRRLGVLPCLQTQSCAEMLHATRLPLPFLPSLVGPAFSWLLSAFRLES